MTDAEIIYRMEEACFPDDCWSARSVTEQLAASGTVYCLLKDGDNYAGYILGSIAADEAEIYRIAVLPAFRKQGLGKKLMGAFLDKIKERLGIDVGECTPDGKYSIEATRCIGACGLAPVLTVNEDVYGRLEPDDIDGIFAKYE